MTSTPTSTLSVNQGGIALVHRLLHQCDELHLQVGEGPSGVTLIDAGLEAPGSIDAGLVIAQVCLGGLGSVGLAAGDHHGWPSWVEVHSAQPVLACLASQHAGWELPGGAWASGPARALAAREPLFGSLGYHDAAEHAVLVLEDDSAVSAAVVEQILRACGLPGDALTLVQAPGTGLAGMTLRVARVLQAAVSRAMALGFALGDIAEGAGSVPLPMACAQAQPALCRSWDAIRYGGQVHLVVRGSDAAARGLARQLPSSTSAAFLHPLADALTAVNGNLGQLDPAMLAPAEVWVSNADSGNTWHAGGARMDLLRQQWLAEA